MENSSSKKTLRLPQMQVYLMICALDGNKEAFLGGQDVVFYFCVR